ncbi:hypothetical protein B0H14DRAFT_481558 [Mycena olivaceomarginata]|nr:hypothetical protein B0H14DRAFT_481558 [Mycena olivaceomarginata]
MPTLPFELECEVFEIATHNDRRNAALKLNLSLVARRVQYWSVLDPSRPMLLTVTRVELVYYESVTLMDQASADKFLKLVNSKSPGFFATAVKALCFAFFVSATEASRILSFCTNVQMLACWVDQKTSPDLAPLLSALPLNQLSIELDHFSNIPLSPPTWLSHLTHISLILWHTPSHYDPHNPGLWRLGQLPRMTHVALSNARRADTTIVCSRCASLQVLLVVHTDEIEADEIFEFDPRIVLGPQEDEPEDFGLDWEDLVFRRPNNMWAYAEDVIRRRRMTLTGSTASP